MDIKEKVSHLMGLIEGMEYDLSTKEGRIISEIIDILSDMADEISAINEDVDTLYDYADELDEDLGEVESELYGDVYCDGEDCENCDEYENCCGEDGEDDAAED